MESKDGRINPQVVFPPCAEATGLPNLGDLREMPTCDQLHPANTTLIYNLQDHILDTTKAQRMAEFFSLLADPNRLRLLSILAKQELCVCDLAAALEMSESAVSHQLRSLRVMRLVSYRKQGRKVFYQLLDDHVLSLYQTVTEHLDEED